MGALMLTLTVDVESNLAVSLAVGQVLFDQFVQVFH